jgi:DNA-binding LacI/PurR family transcriptional regulator
MGVTIKDVAKHAGVSVATVSRYLNNSPLIAAKSVEKVKAAMEELQYSPNSIARSFANQLTNTVAFIIDSQNEDSFGNLYFLEGQYGIEKILGQRGYYLMIVNMSNRSHGEDMVDKLISEKRVDGIILPSQLGNANIINTISQKGFPCVMLGQREECTEMNWVDLDNVMGGRLATLHLIANGCKRIAFIGCSFDKSFVMQRLEGYKEALSQGGIKIYGDLIHEGYKGKEKGGEIMNALLAMDNPPDGIVFSDNVAAYGAISAARALGKKIPEEIQVISFDDSMVTDLSEPKMTVVNIDMFYLGAQAATMLLDQLEDAQTDRKRRLLPVNLIYRGTTINGENAV